jgi:hypothetical protein
LVDELLAPSHGLGGSELEADVGEFEQRLVGGHDFARFRAPTLRDLAVAIRGRPMTS